MNAQARSGRMETAPPPSLARLLECPPPVAALLQSSVRAVEFDSGQLIFRQGEHCRGLYLILSGQLTRRAERLEAKVALSPARAGDLVELAASLGDGHHTYTLTGQIPGSGLLLPQPELLQAFDAHPPLRMHLLEELAREVSRAYTIGGFTRDLQKRRRGPGTVPQVM